MFSVREEVGQGAGVQLEAVSSVSKDFEVSLQTIVVFEDEERDDNTFEIVGLGLIWQPVLAICLTPISQSDRTILFVINKKQLVNQQYAHAAVSIWYVRRT